MVRVFGGGVRDWNGLKDEGCEGGARVQKPLKGKGEWSSRPQGQDPLPPRSLGAAQGLASSRERFTAPGKPSTPLPAVAQGLTKAHCLGRAHLTPHREPGAQRVICTHFGKKAA